MPGPALVEFSLDFRRHYLLAVYFEELLRVLRVLRVQQGLNRIPVVKGRAVNKCWW